MSEQAIKRERVAAISTTDPNLRQARQIYLSLADQGFTPEMVRDQREALPTVAIVATFDLGKDGLQCPGMADLQQAAGDSVAQRLLYVRILAEPALGKLEVDRVGEDEDREINLSRETRRQLGHR